MLCYNKLMNSEQVETDNKTPAIYMSTEGEVVLNFDKNKETIWATYEQIAEVFNVDRTSIVRHIGNIYRSGELSAKSTCAFFTQVRPEGKRRVTRKVSLFNLDVIISVGYRVNSRKATKFRIWANDVLRRYLKDGVALNQSRLAELDIHKLHDLESMLGVVRRLIDTQDLSASEASGILEVITHYSTSFQLLEKYDSGTISFTTNAKKAKKILDAPTAAQMIAQLREQIGNSELFGRPRHPRALGGILTALQQTFASRELYPTIAEKAANLLYLVIKDHPFYDGNKRIGAFLFIIFLTMNDYHLLKNGQTKISDRALVALALLIAESGPAEKPLIIALVCKLLEN